MPLSQCRLVKVLSPLLPSASLAGCVDADASEEEPSEPQQFEEPVTVNVDLGQALVTVPPYSATTLQVPIAE